jgi:cytochrome c553
MIMKKLLATIAVLALAAGCIDEDSRTSSTESTDAQDPVIQLASISEVEAGGSVAAWCSDCHGENGVSTTSHIPHLAGQRMEYVVNELQAYKDGLRDNPAMRAVVSSLTDEAMRNVAAYYSLRGHDDETLVTAEADQRAILEFSPSVAKWTSKCNRCHEGNGFADPGKFPILTGQREEYLVRTMHAYQNRFLRASSMMHAMTEQLSPADIQEISAYYASRPSGEMVGMVSRD